MTSPRLKKYIMKLAEKKAQKLKTQEFDYISKTYTTERKKYAN